MDVVVVSDGEEDQCPPGVDQSVWEQQRLLKEQIKKQKEDWKKQKEIDEKGKEKKILEEKKKQEVLEMLAAVDPAAAAAAGWKEKKISEEKRKKQQALEMLAAVDPAAAAKAGWGEQSSLSEPSLRREERFSSSSLQTPYRQGGASFPFSTSQREADRYPRDWHWEDTASRVPPPFSSQREKENYHYGWEERASAGAGQRGMPFPFSSLRERENHPRGWEERAATPSIGLDAGRGMSLPLSAFSHRRSPFEYEEGGGGKQNFHRSLPQVPPFLGPSDLSSGLVQSLSGDEDSGPPLTFQKLPRTSDGKIVRHDSLGAAKGAPPVSVFRVGGEEGEESHPLQNPPIDVSQKKGGGRGQVQEEEKCLPAFVPHVQAPLVQQPPPVCSPAQPPSPSHELGKELEKHCSVKESPEGEDGRKGVMEGLEGDDGEKGAVEGPEVEDVVADRSDDLPVKTKVQRRLFIQLNPAG